MIAALDRFSRSLRIVVTLGAAGFVLGAHGVPAAAATSRATAGANSAPLVYVAEFDQGKVLAYPSTFVSPRSSGLQPSPAPAPPPVETIAGLAGPSALAVDLTGNLYAAEFNANDIKVFAPGSTTPSRTLRDAAGSTGVSSLAVDTFGTVYAVETINSISVYPKGAVTPSLTLTNAAFAAIDGLTADKAGNVFVSYTAATGAKHIGAFPASISLGAGFFVPDVVPINAGKPPQLTIDANGDLLATNLTFTADGEAVLGVFRPAQKIAALGFPIGISIGPDKLIAVTPDNSNLIVAVAGSALLLRYGYPSGGLEAAIQLPVNTISGMALSTSAAPGTW